MRASRTAGEPNKVLEDALVRWRARLKTGVRPTACSNDRKMLGSTPWLSDHFTQSAEDHFAELTARRQAIVVAPSSAVEKEPLRETRNKKRGFYRVDCSNQT
jgi:hypothetical protein